MTELELQRFFIETIDRPLQQIYFTDGYIKGLLTEAKLNLHIPNKLKQAKQQIIRYLNIICQNGDYIPQHILIYDETNYAILYETKNNIINNENNFEIIETQTGQDGQLHIQHLQNIIDKATTIKYTPNETNIIGLAEKYYEANKTANKVNFFDDYLIKTTDKTYKGTGTITDFADILDKLNDKLTQKTLGAFYTPDKYIKIATEYLQQAIENITNKEKDYVIIDRCAGTGNLEKYFTKEMLSKTILNTYEAKEGIVLNLLFGGKVNAIIPNQYIINGTLIENGDALDPNGLETNKHIFQPIFEAQQRNELEIIILENPPYFKASSMCFNKDKTKNKITKKQTNQSGELSINFIKTAIETMKTNHLILFAPIKYGKLNNIIDTKHFICGHICNREHFHATKSGISLIYGNLTQTNGNKKHIETTIDDTTQTYSIYKLKNRNKTGLTNKRLLNKDILAYCSYRGLEPTKMGVILTSHRDNLLSRAYNNIQDIGKQNIYQNISIGCACQAILYKYYQIGTIYCNFTNHNYLNDKEFLDDILIGTFYTHNNHVTKQEFYKTIIELTNFNNTKYQILHDIFAQIQQETKDFTYELRNQMSYEIKTKDKYGKTQYANIKLHDLITKLKKELQQFYNENITPKLFEYELLI